MVGRRKEKWEFVLSQGSCPQNWCTYACERERGERRKRGRQKVSQALRYFLKLGNSSVDSMLNNMTKEDPLQHTDSS